MTDAEFRERILTAMETNTTHEEEVDVGAQCSADLGQIHDARVRAIIREWRAAL